MANVAVQASFLLNTGEIVDMKTTMTEGTATELQTSTDYSVSAVSIGTYGEGKVLTQILQPPQAPNGIASAYMYIGSILLGQTVLQRDVSTISGITEVTIRNRVKEILTTNKITLTLRPILANK